MSLVLMKVLFSVNVTLVVAPSAALFIVIWPAGLFSVTAVDTAPGATGSSSKQLTLTVNASPYPGSFAKSSPKNGATGVKTAVSLSWGAASGGTRYEYCIDTTVNSTCGGTWISTSTARTASLSGLLKGTRYEWQVRAVNAAGTTIANGGTWWTFTTSTR